MTPEEIKAIFDQSLREHESRENIELSRRVHVEMTKHEDGPDHVFLRRMAQREKDWSDTKEKIKGNFIFYLLVVVTGAIGTAIWTTFFKRG